MPFERLPITGNTGNKVRTEYLHGREHLVVPLSMIVPGVLPGSQGPGLYQEEELRKYPQAWNIMPIVGYHPSDPETGTPISARQPKILEKQQLGTVFEANADSKLAGEGWFDVLKTAKFDRTLPDEYKLLPRIRRGEAVELSTGLYIDHEPVADGAVFNDRPYKWIARNMRPDHLAVLPDQVGACSRKEGCGVNVNAADAGDVQWVTIDGHHVPIKEPLPGIQTGKKIIDIGGSKFLFKPASGAKIPVNFGHPEVKPKDMHKREVAASNVAEHFGVAVPETVTHTLNGEVGSAQKLVNGRTPKDGLESLHYVQGLPRDVIESTAAFDYVFGSMDRSTNYLMGTGGGKPHLIDNSVALPDKVTKANYQKVTGSTFVQYARIQAGTFPNFTKEYGTEVSPRVKDQLQGKWPAIQSGLEKAGISQKAIQGAKDRFNQVLAAKHWSELDPRKAGLTKNELFQIAKRRGLTVPEAWKNSTVNTLGKGGPMDRDQMVNWLSVNCECWKGKEHLLEDNDLFTDNDLRKFKEKAEQAKANETALNSLKDPVLVGNQQISLTLKDGKLTGTAKTVETPGQTNNASTLGADKKCPKCGGVMAQGECTKCGYTANVETDDELEVGTESGKPTKNSKRKRALTMDEFESLMNPEAKAIWNSAKEITASEKGRLVGILTGNIADQAAKAAAVGIYEKLELSQLRVLANQVKQAPAAPAQAQGAGVPLFFGAGAPQFSGGQPTGNAQPVCDDVLPTTTENRELPSYYEEERLASRQRSKRVGNPVGAGKN